MFYVYYFGIMIFHLIYISSATRLFTDADLSDILSKSQLNNKKCDVTGLLLYHEGNILQLLEGDEETVRNLYFKIEQDSRHTNLSTLITGTADKRNFPEWFMGFNTVTDMEYSQYLRLHPSEILPLLKQTNLTTDVMVKSFMTVNLRQ
jgi:Sensors of blue-light using FAD